MMDFSLTDQHEMIVASVRRFVEEELYPLEDTIEKHPVISEEIKQQIQNAAKVQGFYAANMPARLGGGGLDSLSLTLMDRELGRASYALQNLVARPNNILLACSKTQVEQYLIPTINGKRLECIALTEPDAGSDLRSMRTGAVKGDDGWRINGVKHFISRADIADFVILFARSGIEESGNKKDALITAFLVDKDSVGLSVQSGYSSLCHPAYRNFILEFNDCIVPEENVLGEVHRGFQVANEWLMSTRLQVAAMALGRAHRAFEESREWAANREQFGQPIGRFQGVSFQLADMYVELLAAELLTLQAAWKNDKGQMSLADASMAKLASTEMLGRVADRAVQIFGGMGIMRESPVARIWRDARVERIWDGTSEIQRHIISRDMLRPLER
jgi:acyl-CoA dehydrogenase